MPFKKTSATSAGREREYVRWHTASKRCTRAFAFLAPLQPARSGAAGDFGTATGELAGGVAASAEGESKKLLLDANENANALWRKSRLKRRNSLSFGPDFAISYIRT